MGLLVVTFSGGGVKLSNRMIQIVILVGREGLSNKGAARRLGITDHTFRSHVEKLCHRLGVAGRSREAIIAFYWRNRPEIDVLDVAA